ncbi:MAG: acetyl-CoA carboxylase biotin carboxyl carrier protein [Elusimicrobia bacterium]|jgi:acetyl-CoA carboxylase biotin carboxyl carrier protein|nr:acetyl-CoA carboxylase biotin carboxyl carrier protein [Elusimicrobiota bacterium]
MNLEELKPYAEFMKKYQLDYLEVRKGDFSLVLGKKSAVIKNEQPQNNIEQMPQVSAEEDILKEYQQPAQQLEDVVYIKAPLVGTFYRAPSPESAPFVEIESEVKKGDTLCIVEAMKVMNEIKSDYNGTVKEILIENATPTEYGQVLFILQLSSPADTPQDKDK